MINGSEYLVGTHSLANCARDQIDGIDANAFAITTRSDNVLQFITEQSQGDAGGTVAHPPPTIHLAVPHGLLDDTAFDIGLRATAATTVSHIELTIDDRSVYSQDFDTQQVDTSTSVTLAHGSHRIEALVTDDHGDTGVDRFIASVGGTTVTTPEQPNPTPKGDPSSPNSTPQASHGCSYAQGSSAGSTAACLLLAGLCLTLLRRRRISHR
jgi:hypothetical protein